MALLSDELARMNPDGLREPRTFNQFVFLWNTRQGRTTPELHRQIAQWLDRQRRSDNRRLVLMVFRDAGKSTLVGLFCAWLLRENPNLRILVLSAEQHLASKMTRNVRRIIEAHPATRHLRPDRPELWAADQLTVERAAALRDPSLLARGIGGNITGARADVVICDDVEVPNTADTPEKRASLRERLREIGFVLVPGGLQLYIGTPHSYYTIYAGEPRPELGEETPFLDGFERLTLPILDEDGRSRWPERFPLPEIEQLRRQAGPAKFRSQMLLQPTNARLARLDPERLVRYEAEIEVATGGGELILTIGGKRMVGSSCWWDPSYGSRNGGDASVVAAVFVDDDGHYWLHALRYVTVDVAKRDETDEATQQCRAVASFVRALFQPAITVETNGLGKFLPSLLRRELAAMGLAVTVHEHSSRTRKADRILDALDPVLAARRLRAHASVWSTPFIEEMREWTPAQSSRDDGLDAVSGCLLRQPVRLRISGRPLARPDWRPSARPAAAVTDFSLR